MTLSSEQLIGLRVRTQSGSVLGRVKSFEIDMETGRIAQYLVSDRRWFGRSLLVNRSQVIQITAEKMIVEDGLAGIKEVVKGAAA